VDDNFLRSLAIPLLFAFVHLAGVILAIIFWRRCPTACALLLCASLLYLLVSVSYLVLNRFLAFNFPGWVHDGLGILDLIAYTLILVAVVANRDDPARLPPRRRRHEPDDDDDWDRPAKPPAPADSTGIQEK
jgi:hypothetical protein